MSRFVRFDVGEGKTIQVEVSRPELGAGLDPNLLRLFLKTRTVPARGRRGTVTLGPHAPEREGRVPHAGLPGLPVKAEKSFEEALEAVTPAADALLTRMRGLSHVPEKVEVEFGITMDAQAGAFIARAGLEANFKVTLTWSREDSRPG